MGEEFEKALDNVKAITSEQKKLEYAMSAYNNSFNSMKYKQDQYEHARLRHKEIEEMTPEDKIKLQNKLRREAKALEKNRVKIAKKNLREVKKHFEEAEEIYKNPKKFGSHFSDSTIKTPTIPEESNFNYWKKELEKAKIQLEEAKKYKRNFKNRKLKAAKDLEKERIGKINVLDKKLELELDEIVLPFKENVIGQEQLGGLYKQKITDYIRERRKIEPGSIEFDLDDVKKSKIVLIQN